MIPQQHSHPDVCARCDLVLDPGSRHVAPEDCIAALRAALGQCRKCGGNVGCLKCGARRLVRNELERRAPNVALGLRLLGEVLRPED